MKKIIMKHNTKLAIKGKKKKLLEVLLEADNESVDEVCKRAGISRQTYYKYSKDPEFSKLINQTTLNACTMRQNFVVSALLKRAESGNIPAIRTVLETRGLIGPTLTT